MVYTWGRPPLVTTLPITWEVTAADSGNPMVTQPMAMPFFRGNQLDTTLREQM